MSLTTGHPSEDFLKDTLSYRDGRISIKSLSNHFSGEGKDTRNITKAEQLQDSLPYKKDRPMAF